jgi:hypothetical protein
MNQGMKRTLSQSGNALWFILLAIVLLGALTILLSRGGTSVNQSGDVEQARIKSGQLMRYAKGIEASIDQMKLRGVSESLISFENDDTATDYTNAGCTTNDCKVFANGGGGQTYNKPGGVNDGSDWIFTGANNVGTIAYPVGTTASRTGNDLVMLLPNVSTEVCIQANKDLGVAIDSTIPEDSTGIATTPFTGTFDTTLVTIDGDPTPFELDGHAAGCFTDTGATPHVTYFYYVILAR